MVVKLTCDAEYIAASKAVRRNMPHFPVLYAVALISGRHYYQTAQSGDFFSLPKALRLITPQHAGTAAVEGIITTAGMLAK
eukprot:IDg2722t1